MLPKYLRPVFDREAYGPISKTEKAVRFAVFVPLSVLCMIPAVAALFSLVASRGMIPARIFSDETGTMTTLQIAMFIITPILFLIGLGIRKYCLPFD